MIQLISSLDNTQEKPYLPTSIFGEDLEVYFGAKLYCPHAVGDGSQCIPFQKRPVDDGFFFCQKSGNPDNSPEQQQREHHGVLICIGGNVICAGWQVTLCDPIWNVSSRSGEACCELLYPVTLLYFC